MKKLIKILSILVFVLSLNISFAQTPPPPNNGITGSGGTTPVGGGAPIGGGLLILISAAVAYGYMHYRKKPKYTITEEIE